jgi:hypothetical protein
MRFDIEIVSMKQYFQIGVCVPTISMRSATIGSDGTWVLYMTSSSFCVYVDGVEASLKQDPPSLNERFGFAYDEHARTLVLHRKGFKPYMWSGIHGPVHACALLGGKNTAMRIHPASELYSFTL